MVNTFNVSFETWVVDLKVIGDILHCEGLVAEQAIVQLPVGKLIAVLVRGLTDMDVNSEQTDQINQKVGNSDVVLDKGRAMVSLCQGCEHLWGIVSVVVIADYEHPCDELSVFGCIERLGVRDTSGWLCVLPNNVGKRSPRAAPPHQQIAVKCLKHATGCL